MQITSGSRELFREDGRAGVDRGEVQLAQLPGATSPGAAGTSGTVGGRR